MTQMQLGYLLKGPKDLKNVDLAPIKEKAKKVIDTAFALNKIVGFKDAAGDLYSAALSHKINVAEFNHIPINEFKETVNLLCTSVLTFGRNVTTSEFANETVSDFAIWWSKPHIVGDSYSKEDPEDKNTIILFAGSQTNGAEPAGMGFSKIKLMTALNCLAMLDIR